MIADDTEARRLPPFQLRPNKFVDRMMFVDLIGCAVGERGAKNYAYISMGATFLHDHHSVYRRIGIEKLFSFGRDADDIKRQMFNRPNDRMICSQMDSSDLHMHLDELRDGGSVVIWLDFMSSKERRSQLQQAEQILSRLDPGDLFRITLNAEYRKFGKYDENEKKKYPNLAAMAADKLKRQIKEYLPSVLESIGPRDLAPLLAGAVKMAAERALKHRPEIKIVPVLATSYADGDRMLTVTCAVRARTEGRLPDAYRNWKHISKDWNKIQMIDVPDLSLREKYFIDRRIKHSPVRIMSSLPFGPSDNILAMDMKAAVESYRLLHRYYPTFYNFDN
ncbi:O-methyltransferase [Mesorhizobium sp. M0676]|uniref:O-methyltransferase n=1 Tax=Mesorhizobium sp. M0676 TaxID=2956984 RepID=UPI00333AFA1E